MTKEQVQDRMKTLESEKAQLQSTLLAYEGALQDCKYWLDNLDKPQEVTEPSA